MAQKEQTKQFIIYLVIGISSIVLLFNQFKDDPLFQGEGEIGKEISIEEFAALKKNKSSNGKRYSVIGHARVSNMDITLQIGRPTLLLFSTPEDKYIEHFELYHGEDKNEFYLPNEFTPEDLVLVDNSGNKHSYNEDVRISFTMKRLEKAIPEQNPETGEYVWSYKQIRIDPI